MDNRHDPTGRWTGTLIEGRDFTTPEDVQSIAVPALGHRLSLPTGLPAYLAGRGDAGARLAWPGQNVRRERRSRRAATEHPPGGVLRGRVAADADPESPSPGVRLAAGQSRQRRWGRGGETGDTVTAQRTEQRRHQLAVGIENRRPRLVIEPVANPVRRQPSRLAATLTPPARRGVGRAQAGPRTWRSVAVNSVLSSRMRCRSWSSSYVLREPLGISTITSKSTGCLHIEQGPLAPSTADDGEPLRRCSHDSHVPGR